MPHFRKFCKNAKGLFFHLMLLWLGISYSNLAFANISEFSSLAFEVVIRTSRPDIGRKWSVFLSTFEYSSTMEIYILSYSSRANCVLIKKFLEAWYVSWCNTATKLLSLFKLCFSILYWIMLFMQNLNFKLFSQNYNKKR